MRKEFSPFSCTSHMIDDLSTERLIFLDRVGGVEDAVVFSSQPNASKAMLRVITKLGIEEK
jgi:hypothetical protein